ncbi:sulfurtransferase [Xanthomonas pisi DSM 18956]|uniref:hypothetical protein n=1 Tax=Xanthomonas pisi TaxID=56457 RepID=UPI00062D8D23|nr:hypothetical protein [Xanthomonas pisi]KLD68915.1 sulfurtransferase [Xanthomonas pisi DSM 18956]
MSKPTLYMPSKPWAYEYKRKLIPNEVLFGPILALAFLIFMIIGAVLDSSEVISSDAVFLLIIAGSFIVPFLLMPINWVGYWYQGRHYRARLREWKVQCAKAQAQYDEAVKKYEYEEAMELVKEIRCKSLN